MIADVTASRRHVERLKARIRVSEKV